MTPCFNPLQCVGVCVLYMYLWLRAMFAMMSLQSSVVLNGIFLKLSLFVCAFVQFMCF